MSIYNEPIKYIKESIGSIISQSFSDFECILVLDNPSREDVKLYFSDLNDKRFKLYKNDFNLGLAQSMNRAAELASADIFARMDADDIAEKNRLELEYEIIKKLNVDVVFSDFCYIDTESNLLKGKYKRVYKEGNVSSYDIAITPSQIHHPTVMMKKSIFEKVDGYRNFPCAQDSDLWMRMQENGASFYCIESPLLRYRINPQGTTQMKLFKQQLTAHYILFLSLERLQKGRDSYSLENYDRFLNDYGLNSKMQIKIFRFGWRCLTDAKTAPFPFDQLFRLSTFLFVPHFRHYYLIKRKKKSILLNKKSSGKI